MPAGDSGVFGEEAPGSFSPTDLLTLRLLKPLSQASFTSLSCEHLTNFPGLNFPEWARLDTQHALFEDTFGVLSSKDYGLDFGVASGPKPYQLIRVGEMIAQPVAGLKMGWCVCTDLGVSISTLSCQSSSAPARRPELRLCRQTIPN